MSDASFQRKHSTSSTVNLFSSLSAFIPSNQSHLCFSDVGPTNLNLEAINVDVTEDRTMTLTASRNTESFTLVIMVMLPLIG